MSVDSQDKKMSLMNDQLGLSAELLAILVCPKDRGKLEVRGGGLECEACEAKFAVADGIPSLVTDQA